MTVAERTREAVRERPFLHDALAAGVVNYTAAARSLDVGEEETVAAALRRYARELEDERPPGDARVRMYRGIRQVETDDNANPADLHAAADPEDPADPEIPDDPPKSGLLAVGGTGFHRDEGSLTAVLATGTVSAWHLRRVLGRCGTRDVDVVAAGMNDSALILVTDRAAGPTVLRIVESTVAES